MRPLLLLQQDGASQRHVPQARTYCWEANSSRASLKPSRGRGSSGSELEELPKGNGWTGEKNKGPVKWGEERRKSRAGGKEENNGRST